jgi:hypothetical protein
MCVPLYVLDDATLLQHTVFPRCLQVLFYWHVHGQRTIMNDVYTKHGHAALK